MSNCFYCSNPATQLCDGRECNRPLCTVHAFCSGMMFFCFRGRDRQKSFTDRVDYCPDCVAQKYPDLPNVGDEVRCYQYTPKAPTPTHLETCIAQFRSGNHWLDPDDESWNRYEAWGGVPVTVMNRSVNKNRIYLTVTDLLSFPEPLRSTGVLVPVSHCEVVRRGNGLPPVIARLFSPVAQSISPEQEAEQTFLNFDNPKISPLQEWELQNLD